MRFAKALEAGKHAVRHSIPRFLSLARELSLEVVGFLFFAFAVFFAFGPFGFVQAYRSLPESMARLDTATPARPTSPRASPWSESYPICVGRSNATESPVVPRSIK